MTPTPAVPPIVIGAPILALPVSGTPGNLIAIVGGGVRMPLIPEARADAVKELEDKRPIERAGSDAGANAFLPKPNPVAPVVPVYPRKQARH